MHIWVISRGSPVLSTIPIPWKEPVRGEFALSTNRMLRKGKWEHCHNLFEAKKNPDCQWHLASMDVISDSLSKAPDSQTMLWTGRPQMPCFGNIIASRLWNNGCVSLQCLDQYLSNLTEILTSSIRNTGTKNMTSLETPAPLRGTAYSRDTCIEVRSEWLTLFTTLTGLTVIFWIYFVFYHRYSSTRPPWKSSSLAVLFCDVDKDIKDSIRRFQTRDGMFERSKNMVVRLLPDDNGRPKFKSQ